MKPPRVAPKTMIAPTMISMRDGSSVLGATEERPQSEDGLGVNLADARLRQAEDCGNFGQSHVFKIIHGKDLPWYIGQFLDSLSDKLHHFFLLDFVATGDI